MLGKNPPPLWDECIPYDPPSIRSQDVTEVQIQNLYGPEPSISPTFDGGNMKLICVPTGNTSEVQNQNLYGSESSIDHLYGGENPWLSTTFQNRITETYGSKSSLNYEEGSISDV